MSAKLPVLGFFHDGVSVPPKEGISVHVYELARALASSGKVHVLLINADRGRATNEQLAHEPFDTLQINPDDYYNRDKVRTLIKEYSLDLVQNYNTYYISSILGPAAQALGIPLVAEHHDLEADLTFLRRSATEASHYEDIQRHAIEFSTISRFMSPHDFSKIQPTLSKVLAQKTILKPIAFTPKPQLGALHDSQSAVFVGNMAYMPNKTAALFICNEVAPLTPKVSFVIIGRDSDKLSIHSRDNVTLLGEVDDLSSELGRAKVGLAPIQEGSGLKIKIITYLEARLPIISTSVALHGFSKNKALIKADSAQEIADELKNLVSSESAWQKTSRAAKDLFNSNFNIETTLPEITSMYQSAISSYVCPTAKDTITTPDMNMFPWHRELQAGSYTPTETPIYIEGASS